MKHFILSLAFFTGVSLFACPSGDSGECQGKHCGRKGHSADASGSEAPGQHIHEHAEEQEKFRLRPEKKEASKKEASPKKKSKTG